MTSTWGAGRLRAIAELVEGLDHIAIEVDDLDGRVDLLTSAFGMVLRRMGSRTATGQRIALLADAAGMKLELIETIGEPGERLQHVAYRVTDVAAAHDRLVEAGCTSTRQPSDLPPARARTAFVRDANGFDIQLVHYEPGSPDR